MVYNPFTLEYIIFIKNSLSYMSQFFIIFCKQAGSQLKQKKLHTLAPYLVVWLAKYPVYVTIDIIYI